MPNPPVITLTTDFGLQDPFVGVMKGVIAGICPTAHVIDITHGIEAFSVLDGALAIWQAWRYFPAGTVHVVVVDPGVGSERKPLLASMGGQWFIAPDNGVLTLVQHHIRSNADAPLTWTIANPEYMLPAQSNTFHGRDIFAPAAAHLAAQIEHGNVDAENFGPPVPNLVQLPIPEPVHHPDGSIEGVILKSDRFGNLLTNLRATDLPDGLAIEIGSLRITRFCRFYAEGESGEIFAIVGSSGLLEITMNCGSAQQQTGIASGLRFRLDSN